MNICFFLPCSELKPDIDRYWSWDNTQAQNEIYMPVIPPATGIELFIHHKDPFFINHKGESKLLLSRLRNLLECVNLAPGKEVSESVLDLTIFHLHRSALLMRTMQ